MSPAFRSKVSGAIAVLLLLALYMRCSARERSVIDVSEVEPSGELSAELDIDIDTDADADADTDTDADTDADAGADALARLVEACAEPAEAGVALYFSPERPVVGQPLRVIAVAEDELPSSHLALLRSSASSAEMLADSFSWGGPPYATSALVYGLPEGRHRVLWLAPTDRAEERVVACAAVDIAAITAQDTGSLAADAAAESERPYGPRPAWLISRQWDDDLENLYAAWVAHLFAADPDRTRSWLPMHEVTRDPARNLLHGHLGLSEDDPEAAEPVVLRPDCADAPFFLRAYFAWKLGLPFGVRWCTRGNARDGPRCASELVGNLTPLWRASSSEVERFNRFVDVVVARTVHTGTLRTLPDDPDAHVYPVALTRDAIRPGTVFADINGHAYIVTSWVTGTERRMGQLTAVDAHPDATVTRKRFSRASFPFSTRVQTGGFKTFRPVIFVPEENRIRLATDEELERRAPHFRPSTEQYGFSRPADFYQAMERLLNPVPPDPVDAYRARMDVLMELLEERVVAVQLAWDHVRAGTRGVIPMPRGSRIFQTAGRWEEYSTPARDLRLLVAVDELRHFPGQVKKYPHRFRIPEGTSPDDVERALEDTWQASKHRLRIEYQRSDGSTFELTLGQIMERADAFEQAYNPNDCPEVRWGAKPGTEEFATCNFRAPKEQRDRMARYRSWHTKRRRPGGV